MNILDIIFATVAGYLLLRGLFRGLVVETASLAGAVGGFFLANNYAPVLAPYTAGVLSDPAWANTVSYFAIFLAVMILTTLVAKGVRRMLNIEFVAWMDHLGGGAVGFAKGALICSIVLLVLVSFFGERDFIMDSRGAKYLSVGAGFLQRFLPEDYAHGELADRLDQLRELGAEEEMYGGDGTDPNEPDIETYEGTGNKS